MELNVGIATGRPFFGSAGSRRSRPSSQTVAEALAIQSVGERLRFALSDLSATMLMWRNCRGLRGHVGKHRLAPAAAKRDDQIDRVGLQLSLGRQQRLFGAQLLRLGRPHGGESLSARLVFVE